MPRILFAEQCDVDSAYLLQRRAEERQAGAWIETVSRRGFGSPKRRE